MKTSEPTAPPAVAEPEPMPDQLPLPPQISPAALLAFRTPLAEHPLSADGKAASVLATLGILFTVLAKFSNVIVQVVREESPWRWVMIGLCGLFIALSVMVVVKAFHTLTPRFPKAPESLAFFGDIARLSLDQYIQRVESMTDEQSLEHMMRYNHTHASITVLKYRQMRWCVRLFEITFVVWFLLFMLVMWKADHGG